MIIINPSDCFDKRKAESLQTFYDQLLRSVGISPKSITLTPYCLNGDFVNNNPNPSTSQTRFFDIGNPSQGNLTDVTILQYTNRSVYHGSLKLQTSVIAATGATGVIAAWLATGPPSNLTNWLYKEHAGISGVDLSINVNGATNFLDVFDDAFFSFLRFDNQVGAASTVNATQEFLFHGLKIDY